IRPAASAGTRSRPRVQPRRHPQPAARARRRALHPRGRHRGQPPAQEAGAAGLHQDTSQRRLFTGAAPAAPVMPTPKLPWYRRALHALRCSLKLRLMLVFLLLAMGVAFTFISGAQKAFSVGWREAARPLLMDYVDRLPKIDRAQAVIERLPITIDIAGPTVNWRSHPEQTEPYWRKDRRGDREGRDWGDEPDWEPLLVRQTADGHRITFGMDEATFKKRPKVIGYTLTALLVL